nr:DedA family protein [Vibrio navarrensis]
MQQLNQLLLAMQPLLEQYGYLALIVSIFLEGIGVPMPGQSLMIAASILSAQQVMSFPAVMLVSWLSCFTGNTLGYLLGYHFEGWLDKKGYISGNKFRKLQSTIQKYGPACLVVSRFIEGMKQFMPLACGVAKMPLKEFLLGNLLATTIWVTVFGLITHYAFEHLTQISQFYAGHRLIVWFATAVLFAFMLYALLKKRRNV